VTAIVNYFKYLIILNILIILISLNIYIELFKIFNKLFKIL